MTITTVLIIIAILAVALMMLLSLTSDEGIIKHIIPSLSISSCSGFLMLIFLECFFSVIGYTWDCPEKFKNITKTPMEIVSMKETDDGSIILIVGDKMERVEFKSLKDYKTIKNGGTVVKVHTVSRVFNKFSREYFELVEPSTKNQ